MSVRIDCTARIHMSTLLAMLRRSRLPSHIPMVCTALTFSSGMASLERPDIPSPSTLSFPLLDSAAHFFHCAIRRRLLSKGFNEVFMNFLGRHSFLTEVLDNRSDIIFLHFANVSHPPLLQVLYISNQAWCMLFTLPIRSNDQLTKSLIQWISPKHIEPRTFWPHLVYWRKCNWKFKQLSFDYPIVW